MISFPASIYIETVLKIVNQISGTLGCMVLLYACISLDELEHETHIIYWILNEGVP